MPRDQKLRVFCYDVSDNKGRRKIARLLENEASRVQFSVFETRMTKRALQKLCKRISKYLEDGDSLRVYTIGKSGERHCETFGSTVPIETETGYWLL